MITEHVSTALMITEILSFIWRHSHSPTQICSALSLHLFTPVMLACFQILEQVKFFIVTSPFAHAFPSLEEKHSQMNFSSFSDLIQTQPSLPGTVDKVKFPDKNSIIPCNSLLHHLCRYNDAIIDSVINIKSPDQTMVSVISETISVPTVALISGTETRT